MIPRDLRKKWKDAGFCLICTLGFSLCLILRESESTFIRNGGKEMECTGNCNNWFEQFDSSRRKPKLLYDLYGDRCHCKYHS